MILRTENIIKSFNKPGEDLKIIRDVSFGLDNGDFISIEGKSGSGKSTLLMILGGLLSPDSGKIMFNEEDLYSMAPVQRALAMNSGIGFVFQQFHLLPFLTVKENILTAAIPSKRSGVGAKAMALIEKFGLLQRANHLPSELSVGERQRTAFARALLNNPVMILADEPTGNLDSENSELIFNHFAEFAKNGGAVAVVTHDEKAAKFAKTRYKLSDGKLENFMA